MSETNNPISPPSPLRVGLVADAAQTPAFAAALRACPRLTLFAQAGTRQTEALPDARWYDDVRVMIAQAGIQALVMTASTRLGGELTKTAAAHGIHIWRTPPLGRNFAETVETAQRLQAGPAAFRIASWWDHIQEPVTAVLRAREGFKPLFSEICVRLPGPPLQAWQASLIDAGGGVLATDAYPMLEALVAMRGLPQRVVGTVEKYRRRSSAAPRETEDTVAAILFYEGGGGALLRLSWDVPPYEQTAQHHDAETTAVLQRTAEPAWLAAGGQAFLRAADETVSEERAWAGDFLIAEMQKFAEAIDLSEGKSAPEKNAPETARPATGLDRHVAVAALVEAIYLAARTGQPETPRKFYEVQGWPQPRF